MNIDIKKGFSWVVDKFRAHPIFTRILTQVIVFITTFGWHNSSDFWHVVCLGSMILMSALSISDGKLRKSTFEKTAEVVEILQDAIVEMVENGDVEIGSVVTEVIDTFSEEEETKENEKVTEETEEETAENTEEETAENTEEEIANTDEEDTEIEGEKS